MPWGWSENYWILFKLAWRITWRSLCERKDHQEISMKIAWWKNRETGNTRKVINKPWNIIGSLWINHRFLFQLLFFLWSSILQIVVCAKAMNWIFHDVSNSSFFPRTCLAFLKNPLRILRHTMTKLSGGTFRIYDY